MSTKTKNATTDETQTEGTAPPAPPAPEAKVDDKEAERQKQAASALAQEVSEKNTRISSLQSEVADLKLKLEATEKARDEFEKQAKLFKQERDALEGKLHTDKVATLNLSKGEAQLIECTTLVDAVTKTRADAKVGDVVVLGGETERAKAQEKAGKARVYVVTREDFSELVEFKLATAG